NGVSENEARKQALSEFGSIERYKEDCRDSWGTRLINDFFRDVRYGLRQITKHKTGSLVVVITLALCIGANTTAVKLVQKIVSNPYQYREEDRIVRVGISGKDFSTVNHLSISRYRFIEEHTKSFEHIGLIGVSYQDFRLGNSTRYIAVDQISPDIWNVVGIRPLKGRFFTASEVQRGDEKLVVLSEKFWEDLGGKKTNLIGSNVLLNKVTHRVIGVAPDDFFLLYGESDAWVPRIFDKVDPSPNAKSSFASIAKLKAGVSLKQANQNLINLYQQYQAENPPTDDEKRKDLKFKAININQSILQGLPQVRIAFRSINAVTFMVLIIGCLNVGGMIMIRNYARHQEIATRRSLGASQFRISRQMMTEVLLLFLVGGVLSLLVIKLNFSASKFLYLDRFQWVDEWQTDRNTLLTATITTLTFALITGMISRFGQFRKNLISAIRAGGQASTAPKYRHRFHGIFVVSQISLSTLLLMMTGILVLNLTTVLQKNIGFERQDRIATKISQPNSRFEEGAEGYYGSILPYQTQILDLIGQTPGVVSVSASNRAPITTDNLKVRRFSVHNYNYTDEDREANALQILTRPDYFKTVGTRLLSGRDFQKTDTRNSEKVAIISADLMSRYYDGKNPVGEYLTYQENELKIIGVAETVQDRPFFIPWGDYAIYLPFNQWDIDRKSTSYMVHASGEVDRLSSILEKKIKAHDPKAQLSIKTFEENFELATSAYRIPMVVTLFFAGIALLLSGMGLFALITSIIEERTREFGIRMAIGLPKSSIFELIVKRCLQLIIPGLLIGLLVSAAISWKINPLLKEINTLNPIIFVAVLFFIISICAVASLLPANRATRISPIETLRYE
ncbi:MAG: ABC transporter permease, partial [Opitutales bacterium]|nr:ABC transporter permease [Opitutales bacterium]